MRYMIIRHIFIGTLDKLRIFSLQGYYYNYKTFITIIYKKKLIPNSIVLYSIGYKF